MAHQEPSGRAQHHGQVALLHLPGREGLAERRKGRGVLGHRQHPRGVHVQAVHHARAPGGARRPGAQVVQHGVHQRVAPVARRGVHHQATGLVHLGHRPFNRLLRSGDEQLLILVEDVQGDRFGL